MTDAAREEAERLARGQCGAGEIEAVMLIRFGRTLESVLSEAEIGRLQRCGQAELRVRLWQVGMGEVEASATATSTAMWLSRQALGHAADPRALDKEVRELADRFGDMTEEDLRAEVDKLQDALGLPSPRP